MPADAAAPVGVFDSGVGGLSVLREIRQRLPHEALLYVADSAHVPYGEKTPDFIRQRCRAIASFLLDRGAKALVLSCNTATAAGVAELLRHKKLHSKNKKYLKKIKSHFQTKKQKKLLLSQPDYRKYKTKKK